MRNSLFQNKIEYMFIWKNWNIVLFFRKKTLNIFQKSMFLYVHSYAGPTLNSCCNIILSIFIQFVVNVLKV